MMGVYYLMFVVKGILYCLLNYTYFGNQLGLGSGIFRFTAGNVFEIG